MTNLLESPFAILGVSHRDNADVIAYAVEQRIVQGDVAEHIAQECARTLMASRPRLFAEVAWLIDLPESSIGDLIAELNTASSKETAKSILSKSRGVVRVNLAAHFCSVGLADGSVVSALLASQKALKISRITQLVNSTRLYTEFPQVSEELVLEGLRELRHGHCEAAMKTVTSRKHPGKAMTSLVEAFIHAEGPTAELLHDLSDAYDAWASKKLGAISQKIEEAIEYIKNAPGDEFGTSEMRVQLELWDEYSQPQQLLCESRGLDEPKSREIYDKVRSLCIWLANEEGDYSQALKLSNALLDTFPELPTVVVQGKQDAETLESLVFEAKADKHLEYLLSVVEEIRQIPKNFKASLELGSFSTKDPQTVAGKLYAALLQALDATSGSNHSTLPWQIVRSVAIELHNEHDYTNEALILLRRLLVIKTSPPMLPAMRQTIEQDITTLDRNLEAEKLKNSLKVKDWESALHLINRLLKTAGDQAELYELAKTKSIVEAAINQKSITQLKWVIGIGAVVALTTWAVISESGSNTGSHTTKTTYNNYARNTPTVKDRPYSQSPVIPQPSTPARTIVDLAPQIEEGRTKLGEMEAEYKGIEANLTATNTYLNRYREEVEAFERHLAAGTTIEQVAYDDALSKYNQAVGVYNGFLEDATELYSRYELQLAAVNLLIERQNDSLGYSTMGIPDDNVAKDSANTNTDKSAAKHTRNKNMPTYTGERLTYTVQSGDTLSKVASHFGIPVVRVMAFNPLITTPDQIHAGQELLIPGSLEEEPRPKPVVAVQETIPDSLPDAVIPRPPNGEAEISRPPNLSTTVVEQITIHTDSGATGAATFTIGSHKDDVLRIQGTPTSISKYPSLGFETWSYDFSSVNISTPGGQVVEWNNSRGNLKVKLTHGSNTTGAATFTIGSHKDDVLRIQGTPTSISKYPSLGFETWSYDFSSVNISTPGGQVVEWNNSRGNLKVKLTHGSNTTGAATFTIGSHKDDVLRIQGTPTSISKYPSLGFETWSYDFSSVNISTPGGQVVEWNNSRGNLKVR